MLKVQVAIGAKRPPRDEQPRVLGGDRVGVDDPKIHPGDAARVKITVLHGDGGGNRQPQAPSILKQRDRPDRLHRVRDRSGQPHPQRRLSLGDRQPHSLALDHEGALVEPHGNQGAFAAWEPGRLTLASALGGLEPGVAVAAQHRPCPDDRQLPERSRAGELAAQRLIAGHRLLALLVALPVAVQQPRPHVPGRPQQPIAASGLPAGEAQVDRGSPMHQAGSSSGGHGELMFDSPVQPVKTVLAAWNPSGKPQTGCRPFKFQASRHLRR
jgi:hypothetical protein